MIIVYGLKNCDTCKRALKWLESEGIEALLHDLRDDGLEDGQLRTWVAELGWENMLNRRGTTWRKLPAAQTKGVNEAAATAMMSAYPALIKRPLFDLGEKRVIGFRDQEKEIIKKEYK
ncbi:MAG: Spx/MgsR family RNA polymerase-binding regulatory protein [Rhodospirillales bacterium]|nr:Spx/MgsR family RNA polymerase-binding regulatory protein [Rhodospirillales bacterium]